MKFKTYDEFMNENSTGQKFGYGCAMVHFDFPEMEQIHKGIENDHVYSEEGDRSYGKESEPHVTLLYGLHSDEIPDMKVLDVVKKHFSNAPTIRLYNASVFKNDKYHVLKFEADCGALHNANQELRRFPHTSDYPDYQPHTTVAYMKVGKADDYVHYMRDKVFTVKPSKIVYSKPDGKKVVIDL